jgi:hypothetical protein
MKETMKAASGFLLPAVLTGCTVLLPSTIEGEAQKLWCGDALCRWSVEEGEAHPVRTWHELDPEVRLSGPTARLSRVDTIPPGARLCATFDVWVRAPEGASVRFEVDLAGDGTVEHSEALKSGQNVVFSDADRGWPSAYDPRIIPGSPSGAASARLSLVKSGPGDVELYPVYVRLRACPVPPPDAGP